MYNKKKIFEDAKKAVEENKLFFIQDIVGFLPVSLSTFYLYFPDGSEESEALKAMIDKNRIQTKQTLREKWYDSDNATLQIALYKTICSSEERKCLSSSYTDITSDGEKLSANISIQVIDNKIPLSSSEDEIPE